MSFFTFNSEANKANLILIYLSFSFCSPLLCSCPPSVCHRGYFNCSYSPCPAVCTVYSDRHYHTFDGLEYDYQTDCQVYLLKVSIFFASCMMKSDFVDEFAFREEHLNIFKLRTDLILRNKIEECF